MHAVFTKMRFQPSLGHETWFDYGICLKNNIALCVLTERPDNPGFSITNNSEELVSDLYNRYNKCYFLMPPDKVIWAEGYEYHHEQSHVSVVTYTWSVDSRQRFTARNPIWHNNARDYIKNLVEILRED